MDTSPESWSEVDLLEHSKWLRSLARVLVADAETADDLVQEAWTSALSKPHPGVRVPRAYFAGVVRNLARQLRRGTQRRTERERAAAREEALPSSAELVERLEIQRIVVETLREIEEPYRTTLLLRYVEDRSSADIARLQGVPAGTVRMRLQRALHQMRERLDRRFAGDRRAWMLALAPWTRGESSPARPTVAPVGSIASPMVLLPTAALGVIALVLAAVVSREPAGNAPEEARLSAAESSSRDLVDDPAGEARVVAASALLASTPAVATSFPATHEIRARILDLDGVPIEGARLSLEDAPIAERLSATSGGDGRVVLAMPRGSARESDADASGRGRIQGLGYVGLPAPVEGALAFEVRASGRRTLRIERELETGSTTWLGDLELAPGGTIVGRVTSAGGVALAKAQVFASRDQMSKPAEREPGTKLRFPGQVFDQVDLDVPRARVARDGSFTIEGVTPGHVRVWAKAPGTRWSYSASVAVRAGAEAGPVEIELAHAEPGDYVRGRIVDARGRPKSGVTVQVTLAGGDQGWHQLKTESDGSFELPSVGAGVQRVSLESLAEPGLRVERDVVPGPEPVEIVFDREQNARWSLEVRDVEGRPVCDGEAAWKLVDGTRRQEPKPSIGPDARVEITAPNAPYQVIVRAPGHVEKTLGPFDPAEAPRDAVATLELAARIEGVVRGPDGPIEGASVRLLRTKSGKRYVGPDWTRGSAGFVHDVMLPGPGSGSRAAQTTTDARGAFRIGVPGAYPSVGYFGAPAPPSTQWVVFAEKEGFATATSEPIEARAEETLEGEKKLAEVELLLVRGGAIEGRVHAAGGREPTGWSVRATDGRGAIRMQTLAPDGLYRFEHLRPGGWQVRAFPPEASRATCANLTSPVEPVVDVLVVEGSLARFDLALTPRPVLVGRLRFDGASPGNWIARAGPSGRLIDEQPLDPEGRFRVRLVANAENSLVLQHSGPDHSMSIRQTLAPGAELEAWSLHLLRGQVRGTWGRTSSSGMGREQLLIEWAGAPGVELRVHVVPDEQGRFGPIAVPAGRVRFSAARGPGPGARPTDFVQLGEVDVIAGAEASVELP